MKSAIRIILVLLLGFCGKISFGQNSRSPKFVISKPYATIVGKCDDTISWEDLINATKIELHGCQDCKVAEFYLQIREGVLNPDDTIVRVRNITVNGIPVRKRTTALNPYNFVFVNSLSDKINSKMKECFKNSKDKSQLRILVYDIKVITKSKEEKYLKQFRIWVK